MALKGFVGTTNQLKTDEFTPPSPPYWLFGWYYPTTFDGGGSTNCVPFSLRDTSVAYYAAWNELAGDAKAIAVGSSSLGAVMTLNAWNNFAIVVGDSTHMWVYANGVIGALDSTATTAPGAHTRFYAGGLDASNFYIKNTSLLEYLAFYTGVPGGSDIANLQTLKPSAVNAANLRNFWTLNAATDIVDAQGNNDLKITGAGGFTVDNSNMPPVTSSAGKTYYFMSTLQNT